VEEDLMGQREVIAEQYLQRLLTRRQILKAGAAAPLSAAFLAACGGATTSPSPSPAASSAPSAAASAAGSPSPAKQDWSGVTIQLWSGGTTGPPAEKAAADWEAATGGKAVITVVPFAERALKFAGLISSQDSTVDGLYISGDFAGRFGDRLYEDLDAMNVDTSDFVPAILPILSSDGALRGLPQHSEMEIFIYNKTMFEAAGLDPDSPPDSWDALYAVADKLHDGNRYGCAVPWTIGYGPGAYYLCFLNSIPDARLLSDDRTQLLFDKDAGLQAFKTIEAGFKAQFFDPNIDPTVDDYGTGKMYNAGQTASQINFAELWGYAVGGDPANFPSTLKPEEVGATILPGVTAGTSGSINGFEGFGLNKYGKQKEATLSFLQYMSGPEYQKKLNLTKVLPSSRTSVLNDPEVKASYAVGEVLAKQGGYNLDRYAAPYDWTPPFSASFAKLYRGEIAAEQAHEETVKGVQDIIVQYLSS
jgi:ABC-type glycerol-3-phosphate transport system substrate-binding protein